MHNLQAIDAADDTLIDIDVEVAPERMRQVPAVEEERLTVRREIGRVARPRAAEVRATPAQVTVPAKPDRYDPANGETREDFLRRRRGEETLLDAKTPDELIAAIEGQPYLKEIFYQAVRALPAAAMPAPVAAPKRGMLSRIGGWFKRQAADWMDDVRNPTAFVKADDWMARKQEMARRILAAPELRANANLYGEYVLAAAERMRDEFALAA